jgi:molecular chaperone DnaJ
MGMQMQSTATCPSCSGRGQIVKSPCGTCKGKGKVYRNHKQTVHVPAGIDHGQGFAVAGQGCVGSNGGGNGDLLVEVYIKRHAIFQRDGSTVYCEVPITFTQAALGAEIQVPTLDGTVSYDIPEGTQTGTTFTIREKGIPSAVSYRRRGDHKFTVVVETPTKLSKEQKELLRQLDEGLDSKCSPKRKKFIDILRDIF